jgi:hypothetical protein
MELLLQLLDIPGKVVAFAKLDDANAFAKQLEPEWVHDQRDAYDAGGQGAIAVSR